MPEPRYVQGVFKKELKNRFLCLVEVEGKDTLCYIPSSCRLSNFIDLTGKTVLLSPVTSSNARTEYAVYALHTGRQFILLNLSQANKAIENNIKSRRFSFLGKRKIVKKEFIVENYKSDFYIKDTHTIVEVKSILSFEKEALFPTVYSQRAIGQLTKLCGLMDRGYHVCYIFVSLNPTVLSLRVNNEIVEYCDLFNRCLERGMELKGFSLKMKDEKPIIHSNLNILI